MALVLSGTVISQVSHGNQPSAFMQLFNEPLLSNQEFSADNTALSFDLSNPEDTFRRAVLKRAFQVNDTELVALYSLAWTDKNAEGKDRLFTSTIENLSLLYLTSLLAKVHNLSVSELSMLLSVSPFAGKKVDSLSESELASLVGFLGQYTQWLKEQNWTVSDLYLMTTDRYSTTLSPDIENLITTLQNGLRNQSYTDATLLSVTAPFIAAAVQLDSAETALAILQWLDQLKPLALTVKDFLALVMKEHRTEQETTKLVAFSQVLGQLSLIVRNVGLSSAEASWIVAHPTIMAEEATVLPHDIATLRGMTELHSLLARCGAYASEVLASLRGKADPETNKLTVKTIATVLTLDEQALQQALRQVSDDEYFSSWLELREALQWLDVATTLGITPDDVAKLVALKYADSGDASHYSEWAVVSFALQAGLNAQQTAQLQATLDESISAAVSAYVIKSIAPSRVTNRDQLYSWLLIDNQVSAQVKTTRLAEATASMQLYVNRALSGQEEGVDNTVKARPFFTAEVDYKTIRYSGKERDATGLYYYGYRYYQPWACRWLSADPAGTVDGLNLYRMVRNNPVTLMDIDGLIPYPRVNIPGSNLYQPKLNTGEDVTLPGASYPPFASYKNDDLEGKVINLADALTDNSLKKSALLTDLINPSKIAIDSQSMATLLNREGGGVFSFNAINVRTSADESFNALHIVDTGTTVLQRGAGAIMAYWAPQGGYVDIPLHPERGEPELVFTPGFSGCSFVADKLNDTILRIRHVEGGKEDKQYNDITGHGLGMIEAMEYRNYGFHTDEKGSLIENIQGAAFMQYQKAPSASEKGFWEIKFQSLVNSPSIQSLQEEASGFFTKQNKIKVKAKHAPSESYVRFKRISLAH